jgi:hypothetical protein
MSAVAPTVQHLVLWSDSCGGQNRNIKICTLMLHTLIKHSNLVTITFRFRVPGHSFLPNDSAFGDVECELRKQQRLYLPEDIVRVMTDCRKKDKFVVTRMQRCEFKSTANLERSIVNRKVDVEGKPVY